MPDQKSLESFIANSFRSVWALELLKLLAEQPGAYFTSRQLIDALRASEAVVEQGIANLTAAGLAIADGDGGVALAVGSARVAELVRAAIDFYGKSPDKVRRLIVAQSAPGVTAFADAFRLRKS
jgi:DNA-binding IclR family transcriptional regulator